MSFCAIAGSVGCEPLQQADLDWFADQGVPSFALLGYRASGAEVLDLRRRGMIAAAADAFGDPWFRVTRSSVRFLRGGRFMLPADARGDLDDVVTAYVMPEVDPADGVVDLVAWHPRTGRLASWLGRAGLLGGATVEADPAPLPIHTSPLGWLASYRTGVVVVHEGRAGRRLLDAGRPLWAEDLTHGEALDAMLARLRPRILVSAETEARAA